MCGWLDQSDLPPSPDGVVGNADCLFYKQDGKVYANYGSATDFGVIAPADDWGAVVVTGEAAFSSSYMVVEGTRYTGTKQDDGTSIITPVINEYQG